MALYDKITRGNVVSWTITFLDGDGNPLSPDAAVLNVDYLAANGARTGASMVMDETTDGSFTAEWDSLVARPGRVYWAARADNPSAAEDGDFQLKANPANLGLAAT